MNIAILGFAGQGKSSYEYWNTSDNQITICDQNTDIELPEGAQAQLGPDYLKNLDQFDLLIRTPVMHPKAIVEANGGNPDILDKVWSNTNEFFKVCPSKNIIGVTGTKGKGTTSTLITKILEAAGHTVHLGGNIGIPPLEMLKDNIQPDDWVVLELANFQLIDLQASPHIAVCLMIEAEHLDWHASIDEYKNAKMQLFANQDKQDIAIYYDRNAASKEIATVSQGSHIPYFAKPGASINGDSLSIDDETIIDVDKIALPGEHNLQNVCAAATAVWQITQDTAALCTALEGFTGLPFRIELRRTVDGVAYYDDSFATAPGATRAAIATITRPKVMIIGGYDRGLDLSELIDTIKQNDENIRKVLLIGASGDRVATELEASGYSKFIRTTAATMDEIVKEATSQAVAGDAVVLSPSFASFDMFKNFEERGKAFNAAVEKL